MPQSEGSDYLTIGQLARKMGVTVRTIQFYDQKGLLAPSAKGPGNQRLYSHDDEVTLARILVLKYLGMSLSDIKDKQQQLDDSNRFREQLSVSLGSLESDFTSLIDQLSIVRKMLSDSERSETTQWEQLAAFINATSNGSAPSAHMGESIPDEAVPADPHDNAERGRMVGMWHEMIADAIALMSDQVSPTDPRAQKLAQRALDLQKDQPESLEDQFLLMENITPFRDDSGSFNVLRQGVFAYLKSAIHTLQGKE